MVFGGLAVNATGDGNPHCSYADVSGDPAGVADGFTDLVCHFVDAEGFEWDPDTDTAELTGSLQEQYGSTGFRGTDAFCIVPPE